MQQNFGITFTEYYILMNTNTSEDDICSQNWKKKFWFLFWNPFSVLSGLLKYKKVYEFFSFHMKAPDDNIRITRGVHGDFIMKIYIKYH